MCCAQQVAGHTKGPVMLAIVIIIITFQVHTPPGPIGFRRWLERTTVELLNHALPQATEWSQASAGVALLIRPCSGKAPSEASLPTL